MGKKQGKGGGRKGGGAPHPAGGVRWGKGKKKGGGTGAGAAAVRRREQAAARNKARQAGIVASTTDGTQSGFDKKRGQRDPEGRGTSNPASGRKQITGDPYTRTA